MNTNNLLFCCDNFTFQNCDCCHCQAYSRPFLPVKLGGGPTSRTADKFLTTMSAFPSQLRKKCIFQSVTPDGSLSRALHGLYSPHIGKDGTLSSITLRAEFAYLPLRSVQTLSCRILRPVFACNSAKPPEQPCRQFYPQTAFS